MFTIIIPFYNESHAIYDVFKNSEGFLKHIQHIIPVNDASTDLSPAKRKEILSIDPRIKIIDLPKRQGQTRAILAGINAAQTDYIITMDGNSRQSLDFIPELIKRFEKEAIDMGLCVRVNKNEATDSHMVFISSLANKIINKMFGVQFRDVSCTYKIFKKEIIENVPDKYVWSGLHRYFPLITFFQGKKVKEILDIAVSKRKYGRSKYSVLKYLGTFRDIRNLFRLKRYYSKINQQ